MAQEYLKNRKEVESQYEYLKNLKEVESQEGIEDLKKVKS